MKTPQQRNRPPRDGESGTITIIFSASLIGLCAMAALAVDMGYRYQYQRGVQAAADAAVMAGLPALTVSGGSAISNATSIAAAVAAANGYPSPVTNTATATTLTVTLSATPRTFFGSIFGLQSRTITATAVGQAAPSAPSIVAFDTSCTGVGIRLDGGQTTVTGAIESAGALNFYTGPAAVTEGPVTYNTACPPYQTHGDSFMDGPPTSGSAPVDPFGFTMGTVGSTFPPSSCTFGNFLNTDSPEAYTLAPGGWQSGNAGGGGVLQPGIYCSGGGLMVDGTGFTGNVTFVAQGDIEMSGTGITLTAFSNNLIAFSNSTHGDSGLGYCASPEAVSMGSTDWQLNGNIYAPNGCISAGSGSAFNVNGSLVGKDVNLHVDGTINSGGALVGNYYLNN